MLIVKDLHVYYGGIHAIKGISIEVADEPSSHRLSERSWQSST